MYQDSCSPLHKPECDSYLKVPNDLGETLVRTMKSVFRWSSLLNDNLHDIYIILRIEILNSSRVLPLFNRALPPFCVVWIYY